MGKKYYRIDSGRNPDGRKQTNGNRLDRALPENERQVTITEENGQREKVSGAEIPDSGDRDDEIRAVAVREAPAEEILGAVFSEVVSAGNRAVDMVSSENQQEEMRIVRSNENSFGMMTEGVPSMDFLPETVMFRNGGGDSGWAGEIGQDGFPALDAVPAAVFPVTEIGRGAYSEEDAVIFGDDYGMKAGAGGLSGGAVRRDRQQGVTRAEMEALLDEKLSALRVYVLESDITQAQNAVKSVVELATF